MTRRDKGKKSTLLVGVAGIVVACLAGWGFRQDILFRIRFQRIADGPRGFSEFRDRRTEALFLRHQRATDRGSLALTFDGVDDFVEIPHSQSLTFGSGVAVACRVFVQELRRGTIVNKWHVGMEDLLLEITPTGRARFHVYVWSGFPNVALESREPLPRGKWCHVVGTYHSAYMRIYVDGQLQAEVAESRGVRSSSSPLRIGGVSRDATLWPPFLGKIDDLALWNRGLSHAEMQWLTFGLLPKDGLVALYVLDEGQDQTVHDLSGEGNDSRLRSSVTTENREPIRVPGTGGL